MSNVENKSGSESSASSSTTSAEAASAAEEAKVLSAGASDADRVKARWPLAMSIGVATLLFLFVVLVGVMYYFTRPFDPDRRQANDPSAAKKAMESIRADAEELNRYGWSDRKKKIVRLPIERAMELLADEAESKRAKARTTRRSD